MISLARTEVNAVPAASQPESQEDILEAALASLTDDIPPDEADWAVPDPDTGRPAELAGLSAAGLAELIAAEPARLPEPLPAGCLPRDGTGCGTGFADGGVLDVLAAGMTLARFADDAYAEASDLDDDSLIGVLRAWDRLTSWAQARRLGMIAQLARRRPAGRTPPAAPGQFPARLSEFLPDEIAMALTLTKCAAETQLGLALDLAARPATAAALEAGRIDLRRAQVILDAVAPLSAEHAAAVEAAVLPSAPGQTTGELRKAVTAAVLALDPQALRRRREEAEKRARVESWTDPDGTATLTGRSLPPAGVLAADKRLCQVAAYWKRQIRAAWKQTGPDELLPRPEHGMDLLRARAYLALLLGQPVDAPPADLLPPAQQAPGPQSPDGSSPVGSASPGTRGPSGGDASPDPGTRPDGATGPDRPADPDGQPVPAGLRHPDPVAGLPPLAGLISLTLPLTTLLGVTDHPGEAAGYGPLHADTARLLACALAGHRATRWQIILTGPGGHALAAGTARGPATPRPPGSGGGWTVQVTAEPIATTGCDHRNREDHYQPSPALQRLVRARTTTCAGPGCRRPATACDLDHTLAYDHGGITCECGIGPGCRRCHRRKQDPGWTLEQPSPGVMIWTTPAGRRYTTYPSKHPT
jgi:hypothetical protein